MQWLQRLPEWLARHGALMLVSLIPDLRLIHVMVFSVQKLQLAVTVLAYQTIHVLV